MGGLLRGHTALKSLALKCRTRPSCAGILGAQECFLERDTGAQKESGTTPPLTTLQEILPRELYRGKSVASARPRCLSQYHPLQDKYKSIGPQPVGQGRPGMRSISKI